ncbi:DUF3761 domain-containing protein [Candidatus Viadribacter manganicus]|uniref:Uncharacterized protein n=1 Tax=Candidatus Viadribacter manganicus TaxID=1759059 RepID=A0A1B1AI67_9PROT|nr:DUF3761 domain-containing protein [Candidatus Viadribacter manganicus]ANP46256.1 hypothetical protein ATE48_10165 [Candidatus Viadribacter manganicus]
MKRALAAALLLAACASEPIQPVEPLNLDPLAFEEIQLSIEVPSPIPEGATLNGRELSRTVTVDHPTVTAICRNGWVSYSQHRRGTCSGHRGVREWVNRPAD